MARFFINFIGDWVNYFLDKDIRGFNGDFFLERLKAGSSGELGNSIKYSDTKTSFYFFTRLLIINLSYLVYILGIVNILRGTGNKLIISCKLFNIFILFKLLLRTGNSEGGGELIILYYY